MSTFAALGLSVRETAWLLSLSESQVRYQLRVGLLSYAVKPTLVSVESVRAFYSKDPFAELRDIVLHRVLIGESQPPRLATRHGRHSIHSLVAEASPAYWPGTQPNTTFVIRPISVHSATNKAENT